MMFSWFRRCFGLFDKNKIPAEWFVVSSHVRLALLQNPIPEDMFWISFELSPLTIPADLRVWDDDFWLYGSWEIIDTRTKKPVPDVIASSKGINRQTRRILLRGIHWQ